MDEVNININKDKKKSKKSKRKFDNIEIDSSNDFNEINYNTNESNNIQDTEVYNQIDTDRIERKKAKKEAKKLKKLQEMSTNGSIDRSTDNVQSNSSNYIEDKRVKELSSIEVSSYRDELGIIVHNESDALKYKPIKSFDYLTNSLVDHCPYVIKYFDIKKFKTPSPIQSQCWPPLLDGRDVIGIAATGSGKTLAFLIPGLLLLEKNRHNPLISYIDKSNASGGRQKPCPRMLILAPTRELALQSYQVIEELGGPKGVCIYGGVNKDAQIASLRAGAEIVVATPGRLLDLLEANSLSLQNALYVVLDEADRMLDEGFEPSIRKILLNCPIKNDNQSTSSIHRQTVMFSATWPEEIRKLAETFLSVSSVRVTVGSDELSANHRVKQIVEILNDTSYPLRDKKLIDLLDNYHKSRSNRCLIFVLYKKEAVTLQRFLTSKGYIATSIHGDKSQIERFQALNDFKSGSIPLLIATDVAARGLDIPQVEYVINYSFPLTVEDYVHRIGRTGRGGSTGISHTFFTDNDKSLAGALVNVLQEANQDVPKEIYKFPLITKKKQSKLYGDFGPKTELQGKKATKITFDD